LSHLSLAKSEGRRRVQCEAGPEPISGEHVPNIYRALVGRPGLDPGTLGWRLQTVAWCRSGCV